jgi:hypothetical protein
MPAIVTMSMTMTMLVPVSVPVPVPVPVPVAMGVTMRLTRNGHADGYVLPSEPHPSPGLLRRRRSRSGVLLRYRLLSTSHRSYSDLLHALGYILHIPLFPKHTRPLALALVPRFRSDPGNHRTSHVFHRLGPPLPRSSLNTKMHSLHLEPFPPSSETQIVLSSSGTASGAGT